MPKPLTREQKIEILTRWYWLMCDVAKGKAFRAVEFDMSSWGLVYSKERDAKAETRDPWCGTAACAAGYLAFSGILPGVKVSKGTLKYDRADAYVRLQLGRLFHGDADTPGDINDGFDLLPAEEWEIITTPRPRDTPRIVANRIQRAVCWVYDVDPATVERPASLPWDGRQTAFPK